MAVTQLTDVVIPEVFTPYVIQRTAELSRLFQSGIIQRTPTFDELASGKGKTVNMPFWDDLSGDSEVLSDSNSLTPDKITADGDIAHRHFRGKAWQANQLVEQLTAEDPMAAIGDLVANWWARRMQSNILIPTLKGIFATTLASTHVHDISITDAAAAADENKIGAETMLDATGLLGDAWEKVVGLAMHSVPFRRLQKLGLIETEQLQDQSITINRFLGREVIVDDGMPRSATTNGYKYDTYLFGAGAIAMGEDGNVPNATETDRDSLAGNDILISRRGFILHPRGVAWTGTAAGASPTSTELLTGSNWTKKYEDKNIPILKLTTNG